MNTGYLYKLCCLDPTITEIYVGSCISKRTLSERKYKHKNKCNDPDSDQYNKPAYAFIRDTGGFENWTLVVLEEFQYSEKHELHARERYWIETLKSSLNAAVPTRTKKEYQEDNIEWIAERKKQHNADNKEKYKEYFKKRYEANKEQISEQKKQHYNENKVVIKEKLKTYYELHKEKWKRESTVCECGGTITGHKARHVKSQKHIQWQKTQAIEPINIQVPKQCDDSQKNIING